MTDFGRNLMNACGLGMFASGVTAENPSYTWVVKTSPWSVTARRAVNFLLTPLYDKSVVTDRYHSKSNSWTRPNSTSRLSCAVNVLKLCRVIRMPQSIARFLSLSVALFQLKIT